MFAAILRSFVTVVALASLASCAQSDSADSLTPLARAMEERLAIMDEVARYKFINGLAIEDPARETVLRERIISRATDLGLAPDYAARAIGAQISASKMVQHAEFERLKSVRLDPSAIRDLNTELRPEIDAATDELLARLVDGQRDLAACGAVDILMEQGGRLQTYGDAWRTAVEGVIPEGNRCSAS